MRNRITVILFAALFLFCGSKVAHSQDFGITFGAGYGSEIESIGIQAGALYSFTESIRAAVDFVYFLPKDNGGVDLTWTEINANAHYLIVNDESMKFYGLAGLNYAMLTAEFMGFSSSASEVGLNIGAGFEYMLGPTMSIYAETKYVLGDADQFGGFGGIRFYF